MRDAPAPKLHLFVCANRRDPGPLGQGCAERGDELYDALKREVARRGAIATTWITKTRCLGICPTRGATVARYSAASSSGETGPLVTEAVAADVDALLAEPSGQPQALFRVLMNELDALEELQRGKVLELARRLKPGLTLEDVRNPHDFPELDDPDWHYADGVLTGIQSVRSALLALRTAREHGDG